jgi:hypothetical protein
MIKKVIVAGSRNYNDKKKVFKVLDLLLTHPKYEIEIVSGLARGPDSYGKEWAKLHGITCHEFPANWNKYGKRAGYIRNEQMAEFSDILLAFWDGSSKGTQHMVNLAHKHGLKVKVFEQ